jgi:hypothetical protein
MSPPSPTIHPTELAPLDHLRPHPRNYRSHPDDQLDHLRASITDYGVYRNVVCARDYTLLAGHGVVAAARALGLTHIPVVRLDLGPESPDALRLLIGDNGQQRTAVDDYRALTTLLAELHANTPSALLGTGYDTPMLAALAQVVRPPDAIADKDVMHHWVGMPDYGRVEVPFKCVVLFASAADRAHFLGRCGLSIPTDHAERRTLSTWWPPRQREDLSSLRFEG